MADHIFATNFPNLDLLPGSLSFRKLPQLPADQKDGTNGVLEVLKRLGEGYDFVVVDAPAGLHLESEAIMRADALSDVAMLPRCLSRRN